MSLHPESSASEMPAAFSERGTDDSPTVLDRSTEAAREDEEVVYASVDHKAASVLASMPKHCDKFVRNGVALLFAVIVVESGSAVRSLARALKHDKMGVRLSAVITLGALGQHSAEAVSELVSALKDGECFSFSLAVRVIVRHCRMSDATFASFLSREFAQRIFRALPKLPIFAVYSHKTLAYLSGSLVVSVTVGHCRISDATFGTPCS